MPVDAIVLNGGSSAGKSSLAAELKRRLDGTWISLGVDDLIRAISHGPSDTSAGRTLTFLSGGSIEVDPKFRRAQAAWYAGLAAIARAGVGVIVDDVFLDGARNQDELRGALGGLKVAWVGVMCDSDVAEARERARGDRGPGLAKDQAARVHAGVKYDVVVDTTNGSTPECAGAVMQWLSHTSLP